MLRSTLLAAGALAASASLAQAQTEVTWWQAMGGALGETVNEIATRFNDAQADYRIVPVYKGGREATLTATVAAFRAGEQPNIVQVFDAGAAAIIGAGGAVIPAEDLLKNAGHAFDVNDYIEGVRYFYADSDGKMIGMPFNSSTPILYYNEDALEKAGVEPPRTWEEFEEIAPKLKDAGYVPLAQSHTPWIFVDNFFSRHNLQFASNDNGYDGAEGTHLVLSETPALQRHFEKLKEWYDAGLFGYYGPGWSDNQQPFETGEVAMWIGSSGSFGGLQKSMSAPFSPPTCPAGATWTAPAAPPSSAARRSSPWPATRRRRTRRPPRQGRRLLRPVPLRRDRHPPALAPGRRVDQGLPDGLPPPDPRRHGPRVQLRVLRRDHRRGCAQDH